MSNSAYLGKSGPYDTFLWRGIKICIPNNHFHLASFHENSDYEGHIVPHFLSRLAPGMAFVDIGANVGFYSLLAAARVGADGQVIAIEPGKYALTALYHSTRINGYRNIKLINVAVSDELSTQVISRNQLDSNLLLATLQCGPDCAPQLGFSPEDLVPTVRLDHVLADCNRIDVIKIDIEGAEYPAMYGARDLLRRFRPCIFSEYSPEYQRSTAGNSPEDYLGFLFSLGYECSIFSGTADPVFSVRKISEVLAAYEQKNQILGRLAHLDLCFEYRQ
jgi:FkbM family methyltransferase